ncbi:hypothetical protein PT281_00680 [Lactobacillus sp. ESL0701]|uniref:hypothetical protein n=1 Tax=unclassified Lactobacillus TaxID=2620435 RepID=UPI0023F65CB2|nr:MULTISPECIES: hypothetical protein [unclassified Lactobacillus]MDF7668720.1 hypothetical protein [Lactobacillus sp. ESL0703]MDF7671800.1 hypothetical protein [Lactobacillus sp. ESL0701]WEV38589.1 hypothetical protein OZX58_07605 [Lactobacillus sp. ESL0680]
MQKDERRVAFIDVFAIKTFCFPANGSIVRFLTKKVIERLNIIHFCVVTLSLF